MRTSNNMNATAKDSPSLPSLVRSRSISSSSATTTIVAGAEGVVKQSYSKLIRGTPVAVDLGSSSRSAPTQDSSCREEPRMLSLEEMDDDATGTKKHVIIVKLLPCFEQEDDELTTADSYEDDVTNRSLASVAAINATSYEFNPPACKDFEALSESRIQVSLAEQTALEMKQVMTWWSQEEPDEEQEEAFPSNPLASPAAVPPRSSSSRLRNIAPQVDCDTNKPPHEEALEQCFLVDQIVERAQEMAQILEQSRSNMMDFDEILDEGVDDDTFDSIVLIQKDLPSEGPLLPSKRVSFWSALWRLCASILLIDWQVATLCRLSTYVRSALRQRQGVLLAILPLLLLPAIYRLPFMVPVCDQAIPFEDVWNCFLQSIVGSQ